jgi:hypothetical protein
MILPEYIEIQIVDERERPNPLENILLGLKLFMEDNSYHNYSIFKTNSKGKITLTRQQIIDNSGLSWDKVNRENQIPTRFELYIWDGKSTESLIKSTSNLLKLYDNSEFLQNDLIKRGVSPNNLETELKKVKNKAEEDKKLYEEIRLAINDNITVKNRELHGEWNDKSPKDYTFTVTRKKNGL